MRYSDFLQHGGRIGFIAPSFGCASLEPYHSRFKSALSFFGEQGYSCVPGPNVYEDKGIGKSNTPEKCAEEINDFFMNDRSDIIISVGGGETMNEDLSFVDFESISKSKPKWFLGYSDNTNLIFTLTTLCDTAAVYGPCASSFGMRPMHPYLTDAFDLLRGKKTSFTNYEKWEIESLSSAENPLAPLNATEPYSMSVFTEGNYYSENEARLSRPVSFSGRMLGGCLDILTILCGTKFDKVKEFNEKYSDDGIIWFLESCDLNPISITRSLWQLKEAGWFDRAAGFLIGRPMHIRDNMFGIDCREAAVRILKDLNVPVILDVDLGHLPPQIPVISGSIGKVTAGSNSLDITYELR